MPCCAAVDALAKILGVLCMLAGVALGGLTFLGYMITLNELPQWEPHRSEEEAAAFVGLVVGGLLALVLASFGVGLCVLGALAERRRSPAPPSAPQYDPSVRR